MSGQAPLRPQTVTAALTKAGFTKSVAIRSGRIRGWVEYTRGFQSRKWSDTDVRVDYHGMRGQDDAAEIGRIADALTAAGFNVRQEGTLYRWLIVTRP